MVRQIPVMCVMALPIHLGVWSMLWLPFSITHVNKHVHTLQRMIYMYVYTSYVYCKFAKLTPLSRISGTCAVHKDVKTEDGYYAPSIQVYRHSHFDAETYIFSSLYTVCSVQKPVLPQQMLLQLPKTHISMPLNTPQTYTFTHHTTRKSHVSDVQNGRA